MDRTDSLREAIDAAGIDGRRLYYGSASASEADHFAEQVTDFVNTILELGPLGSESTKRGKSVRSQGGEVAGGGESG